MDYRFDWEPIWHARGLILSGFAMTIALSLCALVIALILGSLVGMAGARHAPRGWQRAAAAYVELIRNVPLLIHMYGWYIGLAFLRLPPFLCTVLGLAIYSSAYVAELVRGGIDSVPRGQRMAALASGLRPSQAMLLVVYPQAVSAIAPSLASLLSQLVKDSSLASVIAVAELTYQANAIEADTFRTFEVYITISLLYLALVTLIGGIMSWLTGYRPTHA